MAKRSKFMRKIKRYRLVKLWRKNKRLVLLTCAIAVYTGVFVYTNYMQERRLSADPQSYQPLLQLIAKAESKHNYNAHFGNAANTSTKFTDMTIAEVQAWQKQFVQQGAASSAVGRYQIIDTTLAGLVQQEGVDPNQKFDQTTQDKLAIALLERRGAEQYVNRELSQEEFAANLAKEWAALPKILGNNPEGSYYAGDGLNRALVSIEEVLNAVASIRPK